MSSTDIEVTFLSTARLDDKVTPCAAVVSKQLQLVNCVDYVKVSTGGTVSKCDAELTHYVPIHCRKQLVLSSLIG